MAAGVTRMGASKGLAGSGRWGNAPPMVAAGVDMSHLSTRRMEMMDTQELERERELLGDDDVEVSDQGAWGLSGALDSCMAVDCAKGANETAGDEEGSLVARTFYWRPEDFPLEVATYMQTEDAWNSRAALYARAQSYGYKKMGLMIERERPKRVDQVNPDVVPHDMMDCEAASREGRLLDSDVSISVVPPSVEAAEGACNEELLDLAPVPVKSADAVPAPQANGTASGDTLTELLPAPGTGLAVAACRTVSQPPLIELTPASDDTQSSRVGSRVSMDASPLAPEMHNICSNSPSISFVKSADVEEDPLAEWYETSTASDKDATASVPQATLVRREWRPQQHLAPQAQGRAKSSHLLPPSAKAGLPGNPRAASSGGNAPGAGEWQADWSEMPSQEPLTRAIPSAVTMPTHASGI